MKAAFVLMFCACSAAFAESRVLPPVIDSSIYSNRSASSSVGSQQPSTHAMYEVMGRLEQMQLELQQLRGIVEQQSKTIVDLKQRQNNIYSDLDLRIQELTKTRSANNNGSDSGANQYSGAADISGKVDESQQLTVQDGSNADNKTSASSAGAASGSIKNEKEAYNQAYETLRNGHNDRAINSFKTLLQAYPDGEYADNSQYWLGEAYKVNHDLESAKLAFTKVVTYYSSSPKVPDALLKLGYIELEQNNMAKARDYLTQVTVSHPGTTAAHLARNKLIQLGTMHP